MSHDLLVQMAYYGRLFNDSGSIINFRNTFTAFAVGLSGLRRSIPKILESFSSLPLIFGYLVLRKRYENTAEYVITKKIFKNMQPG